MKNPILFLALILFFASCNDLKPKVPTIILNGNIENFEDTVIKLYNDNDFEVTIALNKDGVFSDTLYDLEDGYYKLRAGKEYTDLYLKDGYNLDFSLDYLEFDESLKYNGIGANENNYLAQKLLKFNPNAVWQYTRYDENKFLFKLDSFISIRQQFLEDYKTSIPEFDKNLFAKEDMQLKYLSGYLKEVYENNHKHYSKNDSFKVSENYYDYRKNLKIENKDALDVPNYFYYVDIYLRNNIVKSDTTEVAFEKLRLINREFQDNDIKKEFIYKDAKRELYYVEKLDEYWALVSYMVTDKKQFKELKKIYTSVKKLDPGNPSPLTSMKDLEGKEYNLEDFKGKYIYIDLWAQWCAPCKKEAPFLHKLEEKYADKDIIFLKFSLDEDVEEWKNYIIEKEELENTYHIENGFKSDFAKDYIVKYIPRFILLDKELNIIDSKAKRPSNEALQEELDKLLNINA